jgi:hypothetical protein
MKAEPKYPVVSLAQDLNWSVEEGFTLVVNEKLQEVFRLSGLEQALWDCLELGFSFEQVRKMLQVMGSLTPEETEREMSATLREWETLGLVEVHSHG